MVVEKARIWFRVLGLGFVGIGAVALASAILAKVISPIFYSAFLVFPYGPFLFLRDEMVAIISGVMIGIVFVTIGFGVLRLTVWGRVGSILLTGATTLYFAAVLVGLWSAYVKHTLGTIGWIGVPAAVWLAVTIPSLYFLLHGESEKIFGVVLHSEEQ